MKRVFNFSAGPAVLPEEVLLEAQNEMFDYANTGMSVMEMSHRSKPFEKILNDAIADLKEIMNIPDNYKIIFVQGGASMQFAGVPLNLMKNKNNDTNLCSAYLSSYYKNYIHPFFEQKFAYIWTPCKQMRHLLCLQGS